MSDYISNMSQTFCKFTNFTILISRGFLFWLNHKLEWKNDKACKLLIVALLTFQIYLHCCSMLLTWWRRRTNMPLSSSSIHSYANYEGIKHIVHERLIITFIPSLWYLQNQDHSVCLWLKGGKSIQIFKYYVSY